MQRKLTDDELNIVIEVRARMTRIMAFAREAVIISQALPALDGMATHATTDGKPYVDPEPPIPDGYRKAVDSDKGRRDTLYFDGVEWKPRLSQYTGVAFHESFKYIVPVDRIPTDDDAKSRPVVMVRDCDFGGWCKATLVFVRLSGESGYKFICTNDSGSTVVAYKFCRFPYRNETP